MALVTLTQTSSGLSFTLDGKDITKFYTKGSNTVVEYVTSTQEIRKSILVTESLADVLAASTGMIAITVDGILFYINQERIVSTTEVDSLGILFYDNAGSSLEKLTLATTEAVFLASLNLAAPQYKVYKALLTQSGTSAPTVDVLENTLGGTLVWSYFGVGAYIGTLVGAFPDADKFDSIVGNGGLLVDTSSQRVDSDNLRVRTSDGSIAADTKLSKTPITVLVKI